MTIDMLRHASLRRLIEFAVEVSAPPAESWPAHDARVATFAVRNLPHNTTPGRAAALMDATVTAAPELKRRAGVKGWHHRVRKPALAYTLYWEGIPANHEASHVRETLEILGAADLQAIIVRRPPVRGGGSYGRQIARRAPR